MGASKSKEETEIAKRFGPQCSAHTERGTQCKRLVRKNANLKPGDVPCLPWCAQHLKQELKTQLKGATYGRPVVWNVVLGDAMAEVSYTVAPNKKDTAVIKVEINRPKDVSKENPQVDELMQFLQTKGFKCRDKYHTEPKGLKQYYLIHVICEGKTSPKNAVDDLYSFIQFLGSFQFVTPR